MTNHYEVVVGQLDLSSASFEAVPIPEEKLSQVVEQINQITSSNLAAKAQWAAILTTVDAALRAAGAVTRIVNAS